VAPAGPTRGFFDAWSRVYDFPLVQLATYRPVHDAVLHVLGAEPCARVLDVGCGTGRLAERLVTAPGIASVVGCDFSAGMLAHAAERLRPVARAVVTNGASTGAALVRGDATRLPFADAVFDAAVSTEAFHWFPDQDAALRELNRVIRPNGRLLLALVSPPFEIIADAFEIGMRIAGQPLWWTTPGRLAKQVTRAGFRVERQRRIFRVSGFLLPPWLTVARRVA
jgi:ubiquinone/menaquinone biosynthesis C-methylase UbiE